MKPESYRETTRAITVTVRPSFLDDQSRPEDNYFVWAYEVTILNEGPETVTLKTRYWKIMNANGQMQEVRGAGVAIKGTRPAKMM